MFSAFFQTKHGISCFSKLHFLTVKIHTCPHLDQPPLFFLLRRPPFFYSVSNFPDNGLLPLFLYAQIAQNAVMAMQYQKNIMNQNADFFLPSAAVNRAHAKRGRAKFIAARAHPNVCAILIVDVSPPPPTMPNSIADAKATMPMVTTPRSIRLDR